MKDFRNFAVMLAFMPIFLACVDRHLPVQDRTPRNVAAWYSGLSVPANAETLSVFDSYSKVAPGDEMPLQGVVSVELKIAPDSMARLVSQARRQGFMPIRSAKADTLQALRLNASRTSGIFKYERGSSGGNERIIVIDSVQLYVWVYYSQASDKW